MVSTMPANVAEVFSSFPNLAKERLLTIRQLILDTANSLEVGPVSYTHLTLPTICSV